VSGNFGGLDQGIPPQAVHAFSAMKGPGKQVDAKVYPDAGRAFENPNNKTGFKPADAPMRGRAHGQFLCGKTSSADGANAMSK
jgi:dienelactone hydrolase